jgi:hypothetical protein
VSTDDDLSQIAADDALLDALGRGEPAPDGDELAGLLQAWRTDLDHQLDAGQPLVGELLEATTNRVVELRPRRRHSKLLTGIAAAILVFGGLAAGASRAGPDSPLWPITKVMYPEQADTRAAEQAISRARAAIAADQFDEASHQLDIATALVGKLHSVPDKKRLTAQINELRALIAAHLAPSSTFPSAGPSAVPGATPDTPNGPTQAPPTAGPGPTGNPGGDNPQPGLPLPTGPGGVPLPTLPTLPPLPLPLPTPTLPALPLPSLPIPVPPILPTK